IELVAATAVQSGDRLRVVPGDFVAVASTLEDATASLSLAWIDGESAPRTFIEGETIPAGAFNVGDHALTARAGEGFVASEVARLLGTERLLDAPEDAPWWQRIGGPYVAFVLVAAATAFALWY